MVNGGDKVTRRELKRAIKNYLSSAEMCAEEVARWKRHRFRCLREAKRLKKLSSSGKIAVRNGGHIYASR